MTKNRTRAQVESNDLDCDLFRLQRRAEQAAANGPKSEFKKWDEIAIKLSQVRPSVRSLMHPDDVKATQ
jgi:hypothetical protein